MLHFLPKTWYHIQFYLFFQIWLRTASSDNKAAPVRSEGKPVPFLGRLWMTSTAAWKRLWWSTAGCAMARTGMIPAPANWGGRKAHSHDSGNISQRTAGGMLWFIWLNISAPLSADSPLSWNNFSRDSTGLVWCSLASLARSLSYLCDSPSGLIPSTRARSVSTKTHKGLKVRKLSGFQCLFWRQTY